MTLASIINLALTKLDEAPQDVQEYAALFAAYANEGYQIALREHYRPRETLSLETDGEGCAELPCGVIRVVQVRCGGRDAAHAVTQDGHKIRTGYAHAALEALCEVERPDMQRMTDEPLLPAHAHSALSDYICYRHLSSGNPAKQSRAQHFGQMYDRAMRRIRHQGLGSVTHRSNLYEATDIRYRGEAF